MKTRSPLVLAALAAPMLAACSGGVPFDESLSAFEQPATVATMDITWASSTGETLTGTIWAYIGFFSEYRLSSEDGVVCEGDTNPQGIGMMTCNDGRQYPIAIEGYGRFSGSYTASYPGEEIQISWQ